VPHRDYPNFGKTAALWRAGFSRRGASALPSARPTKLLRTWSQARLHRIPFDIPPDTIKLIVVLDDPVKILLLPELLAAPSQHPVCQVGGATFQTLNKIRNRGNWRTEHVNMIWHDNEGMQSTETAVVCLSQLLLHQTRDFRLSQVEWTSSRRIEETVPSDERCAGGQMSPMEGTFMREATPQPPRNKYRHSRGVDVGPTAAIGSHLFWCGGIAIILKPGSGAEAPRRLKPALQSSV